jgi:CDP-2,3-bis-(O-geranylgeranyl)-sn-glycerol synthase
MDILTLLIQALKFIFPAYCANAAPVLGGGGTPIDMGRNFTDKKRIFGAHKTYKGFLFGLVIGTAVGVIDCALFNFPWAFAILTPIGALIGDLIAAFFKRRLNLAPGALFPIVDQIDFVVGAIVFALPLGIVSWQLAIATLLITPPIHLFTNFLAYKAKLKKNPW